MKVSDAMLTGEPEALAVWWARAILPFLAAPSLVWGWNLRHSRESINRPVGNRFVAFGVLAAAGALAAWMV